MADITAANSKFTLSVPDVFATSQLLQGYATDDAFSSEMIDVGEVILGVDGQASGAYLPALVPMDISLQADSASILTVFELWRSSNLAQQSNYLGQGVILLPGPGLQYLLKNGYLTRVTPFPQAKRILQPVRYRIVWESYAVGPMI